LKIINAVQERVLKNFGQAPFYTGSTVAKSILDNWKKTLPQFVKIYPKDYHRLIEETNKIKQEEQSAMTKE